MKGIFWLASYPKSGNTWVRCFLEALAPGNSNSPDLINHLNSSLGAASRLLFDRLAGHESSDLTDEEIACMRPLVYERLAELSDKPIFCKIHDAFSAGPGHPAIIPCHITLGVLYIVRNPMDVAVSYAYHGATDVDTAILKMADGGHGLCMDGGKLHVQLPQRLSSWSGHVRSWIDHAGIRLHVVRYEDLTKDPLGTFAGIADFFGLCVGAQEIAEAVKRIRFERLQQEELRFGFEERHVECKTFFRKGRIGSWRGELTSVQLKKLVADHHQVMRRFGYLTRKGNISKYCL